jgi:hypothetical protein
VLDRRRPHLMARRVDRSADRSETRPCDAHQLSADGQEHMFLTIVPSRVKLM